MPLALLLLGIGALLVMSGRRAPATPGSSTPIRSGLVGPDYLVKYTAQALQLAALPSSKGPAMLCSYVPIAALEATDLGVALGQYELLRMKYETAPEQLYPKMPTGRRTIVRLLKRYFEPGTMKELPGEILYESDQKLPVPTLDLHGPGDVSSADDGVPCG